MLGMDIIIKRACEVDRDGEAVLELLLILQVGIYVLWVFRMLVK